MSARSAAVAVTAGARASTRKAEPPEVTPSPRICGALTPARSAIPSNSASCSTCRLSDAKGLPSDADLKRTDR